MNLSIGFLAVIVVLGGVVAALGDYVGRQLGKKRIHLWRMRPKHFAIASTFVAGACGTGLVIFSILSIAQPIREAILEGHDAITKLENTKKQLVSTQEQLGSAKITATAQEDDIQKKAVELGAKNQEIQNKQKDLDDVNTKLGTAQSEAADAKKKAADANAEAEKVRKEISTTTQKLTATTTQLTEVQKNLTEAQTQRNIFVSQNTALNNDNLKLTNQISELQTTIDGLQKTKNELDAELIKLKQINTEEGTEIQANQAELTNQKKLLAQAKSDITVAEAKFGLIDKASRNYPLVFSVDDELARGVIDPGLSANQIRDKVGSILGSASQNVKDHNLGDKGVEAVIAFPEGTSAEHYIDTLVQQALSNKDQTLVVITAVVNSFKTENALVRIKVMPNSVIYKGNQLIAEGRIDGSQSEDKVAAAVAALINGPVRKQVSADGLVPAVGTEAPLGEVTQDQMLALVSDLRNYGHVARVQCLAAQPIRRGDKLKLTFRLHP